MEDDSAFRPSVAPNSPPLAGNATESLDHRYRITAEGGFKDSLLGRQVAIEQASSADADTLQQKARFLSAFHHPCLPAVLDFVRTDSGAILVTERFDGTPLADLENVRRGGEENYFFPWSDLPSCVRAFLTLGEALIAIHKNGIVHHSINDQSVQVDRHGRILLGHWDRALTEIDNPTTMRFIRKSNAGGESLQDGQSSDIQGIGHCLSCAILGSAIDGNPHTHRPVIPISLREIINKAVHTNAGDGYQSVNELCADLQRYLDGSTPLASSPGLFRRGSRWARRHARLLSAATCLAVVVALAAAYFYRADLTSYSTWGSPIVHETFSDNSWKDRWTPIGAVSRWDMSTDRLTSTGDYGSMLTYRESLSDPIAVSYTARITDQGKPGDVSIWWSEDNPLLQPNIANPFTLNGYLIQIGAYENSWCGIYKIPEGIRVSHSPFRLKPGIDHHIRAEIESQRIRLWIDGELLMEHLPSIPITSGHLGLYAYYPGQQFDDLQIWQQDVANSISPLAVGDAFYKNKQFTEAALAYGRVTASHATGSLRNDAFFRKALSLRLAGRIDEAKAIRDSMAPSVQRERLEAFDIDELAQTGSIPIAVQLLKHQWQLRPSARKDLIQHWQIIGQRLLRKETDSTSLRQWIQARDTLFPSDTATAWLAADMYLNLHEYEKILAQFSNERLPRALALIGLGRAREVADSDWAISHDRIAALMVVGRNDEALASSGSHPDVHTDLLLKLGQGSEVRSSSSWRGLIYSGKAAVILEDPKASAWMVNSALIALGRWQEAAYAGISSHPGSGGDERARVFLRDLPESDSTEYITYHRCLDALIRNDNELARELRPHVQVNTDFLLFDRWFAHFIALPFIDFDLGQGPPPEEALRNALGNEGNWGGMLAPFCAAALDPAMEPALAERCFPTQKNAWLLLARAIHGEITNDRTAALAAWDAYTALPVYERLLSNTDVNLEIEAFVQWRRLIPVDQHKTLHGSEP